MRKKRLVGTWYDLNEMYRQLSTDYYSFNLKYKKYLNDNFAIDSGTDYANYIFSLGCIDY